MHDPSSSALRAPLVEEVELEPTTSSIAAEIARNQDTIGSTNQNHVPIKAAVDLIQEAEDISRKWRPPATWLLSCMSVVFFSLMLQQLYLSFNTLGRSLSVLATSSATFTAHLYLIILVDLNIGGHRKAYACLWVGAILSITSVTILPALANIDLVIGRSEYPSKELQFKLGKWATRFAVIGYVPVIMYFIASTRVLFRRPLF